MTLRLDDDVLGLVDDYRKHRSGPVLTRTAAISHLIRAGHAGFDGAIGSPTKMQQFEKTIKETGSTP